MLQKEQLIAELASFVHRAATSLISPSLGVYPLPSPWSKLHVDLMMIHDHEVGVAEKYGKFSTSAFVNLVGDPCERISVHSSLMSMREREGEREKVCVCV
jgi:hypothetical protein